MKIRSVVFTWNCQQTDRQTNKQTNAGDNITPRRGKKRTGTSLPEVIAGPRFGGKNVVAVSLTRARQPASKQLRRLVEQVVYHARTAQKNAFLPRCMECRRGLAMGILSVRLSVRPSVCPSNAWIVTKRTKAVFRFFISYERTFILVLWEGEWLVGGDPFYLKFWVNRPALEQNRRFWIDNRS